MNKTLSAAEINHLRRLLGWVACEIGQSSGELIETAKRIAPTVGELSTEGRQRLIEAAEKADQVPKYVRAAVKALKKAIADQEGDIVDAEISDSTPLGLPEEKRPTIHEAAKAIWTELGLPFGEATVMAWHGENEEPSIRVQIKRHHPSRWSGIPATYKGYRVLVEDYQPAIAHAGTHS